MAVIYINSIPPSSGLVLCDIGISQMNGYEVAKCISEKNNEIKMTAFDQSDDTEFECLKNTISMTKLLEIVKRIMNSN